MADYTAIVKRSGPEVFKMQMRLLMKQVMGFTFPKSKGSGANAVRRDIRRAVQPMDLEWSSRIRNPELRARIEKLVRSKSPALQDVVTKARLGSMISFDPAQHKIRRNARGRVTSNSGLITPDIAAHKSYTSKKVAMVGWARSGWNSMLQTLGGTALQSWVSKFGSDGGTSSGNPDHPDKPSISGTNRAVKIPGYASSVEAAVRLRERKMDADMRRILKGGATKVGFGK